MTESEYIQQHETYLNSIVSRFIARYPEQRWKMRDDLMQEARIALLIAYRRQEGAKGLERRAYICIIDALYTAAVHAYPIRIPRRKFRKNPAVSADLRIEINILPWITDINTASKNSKGTSAFFQRAPMSSAVTAPGHSTDNSHTGSSDTACKHPADLSTVTAALSGSDQRNHPFFRSWYASKQI